MNEPALISSYNYDTFVPENFERWLNFDASPPLGQKLPTSLCGNSMAERRA